MEFESRIEHAFPTRIRDKMKLNFAIAATTELAFVTRPELDWLSTKLSNTPTTAEKTIKLITLSCA